MEAAFAEKALTRGKCSSNYVVMRLKLLKRFAHDVSTHWLCPKSHTSRRISSRAGHFIIAPTDNFSSKYELESMIKLYGRVFPMWYWKMDFQGFRLLCARRVVRFSCFCFTKNCSFLVFFFVGWSFGLKCARKRLFLIIDSLAGSAGGWVGSYVMWSWPWMDVLRC